MVAGATTQPARIFKGSAAEAVTPESASTAAQSVAKPRILVPAASPGDSSIGVSIRFSCVPTMTFAAGPC